MPRARKNSRHTLAPGDVLDAKSMLEMLEGTGSDGGPTCTIDVKTFQETFGAPKSASSATRKKRRETADPSMLKELLESCVLSDGEENADPNAGAAPSPLPRRSPRVAAKSRRMTCDPRLLKKLVLEHSGELPAVRESSGSGAATTVDVSAFHEAFGSPAAEPAVEEALPVSAAKSPRPPWSDEEDDDDAFDETRATMKELRRQLEVEKEVSQDAERERDELAKELEAIKREAAARGEIVDSLETQRDAATRRASVAEGRASRADAEHSRLSLLQLASDAAADARDADAARELAELEAAAEERVRAAKRETEDAKRDAAERAHECALLAETIDTLRDRVKELEKVKITASFASKVRKVVEERDALLAEKHKYSGNQNAFSQPDPALQTDAAGECRQS